MSRNSKIEKRPPVRPDALHMVGITLLKASHDLALMRTFSQPPALTLRIGYTMEMLLTDEEERFIRVGLQSEIMLPENKQLGQWLYEFVFKVDDLDNHIIANTKDEQPQISPQLATTLVSIAFSTMRGLFWHETLHLLGDPLILPVIDPVDFVKTGKIEETADLQDPQTAN